jgi:hypothetical protein
MAELIVAAPVVPEPGVAVQRPHSASQFIHRAPLDASGARSVILTQARSTRHVPTGPSPAASSNARYEDGEVVPPRRTLPERAGEAGVRGSTTFGLAELCPGLSGVAVATAAEATPLPPADGSTLDGRCTNRW